VKLTLQFADVLVAGAEPSVQLVGVKNPQGDGLHDHETVPVGGPMKGGLSVTVAVHVVDL